MRQRRRYGRLIFLGLGLVIALVLAIPAAVVADTTPGSTAPTPVAVGASVNFTGNGFAPNESLSVWQIGPDGTYTTLGGVQTDGSGSFTTAVSFPSAGQWQVTAHSINSGKEFVGSYTAGATTGPTTGTTTGTVPVAPVAAAPGSALSSTAPQVAIGAPISFTGNGFSANEVIAAWETPPGGGVPTALPNLQADNTGAFTTTVTFPSAGQWQVTAHGVTSGHQIITAFTVGTVGATVPPVSGPVTGVPPAAGAANGAGFNGTAASIGTPVTFAGTGFNAGENISLWMTPPATDSTPVTPLPGIQADGTGGFTVQATFPTAGNWQVTAHGRDSAHEIIGRYTVTDPSGGTTSPSSPASTFTSPSTGVPVKATVGTIVTYTATGFNAGETVVAWVMSPDSTATVTPLDSVTASSTGRATISTSFGSAGLWQITLHGRDSGHEIVGKYQATAS